MPIAPAEAVAILAFVPMSRNASPSPPRVARADLSASIPFDTATKPTTAAVRVPTVFTRGTIASWLAVTNWRNPMPAFCASTMAGASFWPISACRFADSAPSRFWTFAVESAVRVKSPIASLDCARICCWAARTRCCGVSASLVVEIRPIFRAWARRVASSSSTP